MHLPINECAQELLDTKQCATENALSVERCQLELDDLRKQNKDLRGEKEALRAQVHLFIVPRSSRVSCEKLGRPGRSADVAGRGCVSPPTFPHNSIHMLWNDHIYCVGK